MARRLSTVGYRLVRRVELLRPIADCQILGCLPEAGRVTVMSQMPKDMRKLMQQAQQMQEGLKKAQEELANKTYAGTSGGGVVTATVSGTGELLSVEIEPDVLDPDEADLVGDLIVAAVNDARRIADSEAAEAMGGLTGGLDLGGLLG